MKEIQQFCFLVKTCADAGVLHTLTLYQSTEKSLTKAKGNLLQIGGQTVLQLTFFWSEGRLTHENIPIDQLPERLAVWFLPAGPFAKADLAGTAANGQGSASLLLSRKGQATLLTRGVLKNPETLEASDETQPVLHNDREKKRLLTGAEPFLKALGISDENGRVHDKKQAKFRQICRFSEYIRDAAEQLSEREELYICDLCCGKSYLSFAAYHVLTNVMGRTVRMSCVDRKQSVMDYCAAVAESAQMRGMHFLCADITTFTPVRKPDMVISLHACDTATDVVLDFAARWGADIVLSTPCCHHQMNRELQCPTLSFIAERPILRQKFCDAATDALRLLKLEAEGYRTDATELIDPEDTPKNVMLRAIRRKNWDAASAEAQEKAARYRAAYTLLYGHTPEEIDP